MRLLIKVVFVFVFVVFYLINFREGVTSHQGYYCFSNFVVIVVGGNGVFVVVFVVYGVFVAVIVSVVEAVFVVVFVIII